MVVPLRESLKSTHLLLGRVDGAEPGRNVLSVTPREGHTKELGYDQLIVTVGSISRALPIPGLVEHGRSFKTLPEARPPC